MNAFCETRQAHMDARNDLGETNDCTVRAVATACDIDYKVAHAAIAKRGRKHRQGAYDHQYMGAVEDLGFHYSDVTQKFLDDGCKTAMRFGEFAKPGHRYVVIVAGHAAGWNGEKFVDFISGRRHRIKTVYHVAARKRDLEPEAPKEYRSKPPGLKSDMVFVYHCQNKKTGNWEYRIMFRESDKVRWLNTKWGEYSALEAAWNAARRRGANYLDEIVVDLAYADEREGVYPY